MFLLQLKLLHPKMRQQIGLYKFWGELPYSKSNDAQKKIKNMVQLGETRDICAKPLKGTGARAFLVEAPVG